MSHDFYRLGDQENSLLKSAGSMKCIQLVHSQISGWDVLGNEIEAKLKASWDR
jgi:hypothetical protein